MAEILEAYNSIKINSEIADSQSISEQLPRGKNCRRVRLDRSKRLLAWRQITEMRAPSDPLSPVQPLPSPVKEPPGNEPDTPDPPFRDPDPEEPGQI